jgi:hypothetical protein
VQVTPAIYLMFWGWAANQFGGAWFDDSNNSAAGTGWCAGAGDDLPTG